MLNDENKYKTKNSSFEASGRCMRSMCPGCTVLHLYTVAQHASPQTKRSIFKIAPRTKQTETKYTTSVFQTLCSIARITN